MCNKLGSKGICKYLFDDYLKLTKEEMQRRATVYRQQRNKPNSSSSESHWYYHYLDYLVIKAVHRNRKPSVLKTLDKMTRLSNFYFK